MEFRGLLIDVGKEEVQEIFLKGHRCLVKDVVLREVEKQIENPLQKLVFEQSLLDFLALQSRNHVQQLHQLQSVEPATLFELFVAVETGCPGTLKDLGLQKEQVFLNNFLHFPLLHILRVVNEEIQVHDFLAGAALLLVRGLW